MVSKTSGAILGLFSPVTDEHPEAEQVRWSEALRISLDQKEGRNWLLLEPDVWIWPTHARLAATDFLDRRKGDRFNDVQNDLLNAWSEIILGTAQRNVELDVQPFASGTLAENPRFRVGSRTAFSRRIGA